MEIHHDTPQHGDNGRSKGLKKHLDLFRAPLMSCTSEPCTISSMDKTDLMSGSLKSHQCLDQLTHFEQLVFPLRSRSVQQLRDASRFHTLAIADPGATRIPGHGRCVSKLSPEVYGQVRVYEPGCRCSYCAPSNDPSKQSPGSEQSEEEPWKV